MTAARTPYVPASVENARSFPTQREAAEYLREEGYRLGFIAAKAGLSTCSESCQQLRVRAETVLRDECAGGRR